MGFWLSDLTLKGSMADVSAGRAGRPGRRYRPAPRRPGRIAARWRAALMTEERRIRQSARAARAHHVAGTAWKFRDVLADAVRRDLATVKTLMYPLRRGGKTPAVRDLGDYVSYQQLLSSHSITVVEIRAVGRQQTNCDGLVSEFIVTERQGGGHGF